MQTFLPSSSFQRSAKVLDNKRLGKQRVEAYQILQVLLEGKKAWANHPAVLMWKGHEGSLWEYTSLVCNEWIGRRFVNAKMQVNLDNIYKRFWSRLYKTRHYPPWLGNRAFHASHRSNLLRKDSKHYSRFGWKEPSTLPYVWPCTKAVNTSK
jgi:Pyrimidine dimer DNA glycosylase